MDSEIKKIIGAVKKCAKTVTLGFDGYVDEVFEIVENRDKDNNVAVYSKMNQFADRIRQGGAGGVSAEIIRKRRSHGGFTANTGNAVASLGIGTVMVGLFGEEKLDPVFQPFEKKCRVISAGNPAMTNIYEFDDGKLMLPFIEPTINFDYASLAASVGKDRLAEIFSGSDIIAVGYWSLMPAFGEIVAKIAESLPADGKRRRMFFDFADVRKREESALREMISTLGVLNGVVPATLSLNEHEAAVVFGLYGKKITADEAPKPGEIEAVRRMTGLDELVVHTPRYAVSASAEEGEHAAAQIYCEKPLLTTGAGDTFNGGYIAAKAAGLSPAERLRFANAVVGCYLRNGAAPGLTQAAEATLI
ncbi:MAG: carbohydrate kinase family protein [Defluviitaleaceae bacterium]|nr:carbohydrate kinase family protein [Defluviitaleaceae bacterium]